MARNENKTPKNYEALAAKAPTQLHEDFAHWLFIQTGVKVDVKTVQLAVSFRMDFQASPENQAKLAERKQAAAAKKKASAARKKAKLEAELAKLKGDAGKAEEPKEEAALVVEETKTEEPGPVQKLTVLYGNGEPEVHKFGCADLKKFTRAKGFTKETAEVRSHTELTHLIYSDMIDSGESSLEDNYMAYNDKPCCPKLDS
ncbi:hypothetical protein SEA_WENTWORTH_90 [Streptomyces phage Wentworth]|nr:hypothetical protein SEA_WENTWORTH_90 [Streptomyces phage Wentworth]